MSRARDFADLAGSADAGGLTGRNLLINGEWQVSQRGDYTSATSLPTSATYYLDRFKFRRNGVTGTFIHKLDQTLDNNDVVSTVRLDVTSTATGNVHCLQIFEDVDFFKNKTITFSARVKSNSTNARLVLNADSGGGTTSSSAHTGGSGWELLKGTATITSGATGVQLYCGIQASGTGDVAGVTSGDFFEISQIQVEVGEQATPFEHRSFGDELARCQRYFHSMGGEQTYEHFAVVGQTSATDGRGMIFLPQTMRTIPSIGQSGAFEIASSNQSTNGTFSSGSSMYFSHSVFRGKQNLGFDFFTGSAGSFTVSGGAMYVVRAYNSTATRVTFDAEL